MNPDLKFTVDLAQLIMLCGLVWGLARMSKAVDYLGEVTNRLTTKLEYFGTVTADLLTRVRVLEDREGR